MHRWVFEIMGKEILQELGKRIIIRWNRELEIKAAFVLGGHGYGCVSLNFCKFRFANCRKRGLMLRVRV